MKVLLKVCPHCGFVMFFSVEILSRAGSADEIGTECPTCGERQGVSASATELDIEEIGTPVDEEAIARAVSRFMN